MRACECVCAVFSAVYKQEQITGNGVCKQSPSTYNSRNLSEPWNWATDGQLWELREVVGLQRATLSPLGVLEAQMESPMEKSMGT